jgi:Fe-Mn family superoxide dismutase
MAVPTVPPLQGDTSADLAPEQLRDILANGQDLLILDVCLADAIAKRTDTIPGAIFRPREYAFGVGRRHSQ